MFIWIFASFVCASATNITPANFDQSHIGKCMAGHVFSEVPCISHARCLYDCMTSTGCLSYNWRREEQLCQLNTEDGTTAPTSLLPADGGCFFSAVTSWPKSIVNDCADHVCATSEQCIPGPRCVKVCLEQAVANAVVTGRTTRYPGGTRTYGCNSGYMMAGTGDTITCQSDGTWTSVTFQCKRVCPVDVPYVPLTSIAGNSGTRFVGDTRTYQCLDGYAKTTHDTTVCEANGMWSQVSMILCSLRDCDRIKYIGCSDWLTALSIGSVNYPPADRQECTLQCDAGCQCARYGDDCIAMCDGDLPNKGRLEIRKCSDAEWGTVCDDCWEDTVINSEHCSSYPMNPIVACRMFGYSAAGEYVHPGPESKLIGLDKVQCSGTESSLYDCLGATTVPNCVHAEDVGLVCS